MGIQALKRHCDRALAENPSTDGVSDRVMFVDRCYTQGGKLFVEAIQKYGCNERGEPLRLSGWHLEYAEAIADFRLKTVFTTGASQCGKTLLHSLLLCYCITEGSLNTLWTYDQLSSLRIQVKSNFRPVMRHWMRRKGIRLSNDDSDELSLFQLGGADAQFSYVSTSEMRSGKETAAAGGIAVGVSRDILFKEERSQYFPGADKPFERRLDASRLPSKPIRELGTPGGGLGIEAEIDRAQYHFYPHYECPHCETIAPLTPKGCLLKPVSKLVNGQTVLKYLSESGRPIAWHHHDTENPVESAYFGCSQCDRELPDTARVNAHFRCLKTGVTLRDFLESLPEGVGDRALSAGITISPLLRLEKTNLAAAIVDEGLNTSNSADWQQQRLGEPSETSITAVTLDLLRAAMRAPKPTGKPGLTIAGIDQGRGQHWLWIADLYLPEKWHRLPVEQLFEQTIQVVRFAQDVVVTEIPKKLKEYKVQFGLIDNEPERREASEISRMTCLKLADQKSGQMSDFREIKVEAGGVEYDCWAIANDKFLKQVLNTFVLTDANGNPLQRLPKEWEKWLGVNSEISPLRHLSAPRYDPDSGKWKRGDGGIDDLYYACMFAQAAFYLWLLKYKPKWDEDTDFDGAGDRPIHNLLSRL